MINYIYWNPKKEIFIIPGINYPIVWYSLFFLIGFLLGYYIFIQVLKRYFFQYPMLYNEEILSYDILKKELQNTKNKDLKEITEEFNKINFKSNNQILDFLNHFIDGKIKIRLFLENKFSKSIQSIKKKAIKISDKLLVYMIVATVIGARLGHLIFYEKPQYYLKNPIVIFQVYRGGLASHGAAVAILIAMIIFCKKIKNIRPKITYLHLLDFICIAVCFAGFCIRVGNFFNQEILGVQTTYFWGVIFGNPMENVAIVPRHPVQLYEAFFYLLMFFILYFLSYKKYFLLKEGKLFSVFLISVFTFRFFIEFLKVNESNLMTDNYFLSMGQYLSIPFIILGIILLFWDKIKSFYLKNNKIVD